MGWDDSDEESEAEVDVDKELEAKRKEEERKRRRDEGLDSDSEKEVEQKVVAKPKPKPKAKAQAQEDEEKGLTAEEKKLLRRKREEEQSARLAQDLFSGCDLADEVKEQEAKKKQEAEKKKEQAKNAPQFVIVDAFEKVELVVQKDVDNLVNTCTQKVNDGTGKGLAASWALNLLKQLESTLTDEELLSVEKAIQELAKVKADQVAEKVSVEKKANTKLSKTTKFNTHAEMEEVYGGGAGDEDWTQEEWDAWMAEQEGHGGWSSAPQAAKGAKW